MDGTTYSCSSVCMCVDEMLSGHSSMPCEQGYINIHVLFSIHTDLRYVQVMGREFPQHPHRQTTSMELQTNIKHKKLRTKACN